MLQLKQLISVCVHCRPVANIIEGTAYSRDIINVVEMHYYTQVNIAQDLCFISHGNEYGNFMN